MYDSLVQSGITALRNIQEYFKNQLGLTDNLLQYLIMGQEYYDFCLMKTKEPYTPSNHRTIHSCQIRSYSKTVFFKYFGFLHLHFHADYWIFLRLFFFHDCWLERRLRAGRGGRIILPPPPSFLGRVVVLSTTFPGITPDAAQNISGVIS